MACKRSGVRAPLAPFKTFWGKGLEEKEFSEKNLKNSLQTEKFTLKNSDDHTIKGNVFMLKVYRETLEIRNYQASTIQKNVNFAAQFLRWFEFAVEDISSANIEDYLIYLRQGGRSVKTIKNHRSAIKVFCDFLAIRGVISKNPVTAAKNIELPEELPVFLSEKDTTKLYVIAEKTGMKCEIVLALNTGLRMSEMRQLKWDDLDLKNRQLLVRKSKGKRPRTIPLNKKSIDALKEQRRKYKHLIYVFPGGNGGARHEGDWTIPKMRGINWWSKISVRRMQKISVLRKLPKGRTGRGWHALRHTFATRAAQAGIDIFKLKDWMGHRKVETTLRYIHMARNYDEDIELI